MYRRIPLPVVKVRTAAIPCRRLFASQPPATPIRMPAAAISTGAKPAPPAPRVSGRSKLQIEVLSAYRTLLRLTRTRPTLLATVRNEFRLHGASIAARDLTAVEYRLRMAHKKIDLLKDGAGAIKDIHPSSVPLSTPTAAAATANRSALNRKR